MAHIDLGHQATVGGVLGVRQEASADILAARRLISLMELLAVLSWTRVASEIAAELDVDRATLEVRRAHLHPAERAVLRRRVHWLEETA